jgi:two-component system response regulator HydG
VVDNRRYRLNVAAIAVPPLRERREDIELLAVHFLREYGSAARGRGTVGFTPAAIDALVAFDWPGNVRQLRAAIERACVVTENERIDVGDLPHDITGVRLPGAGDADLATLTWADAVDKGRADVGRRYLEAVLRKFDGQVAGAAAHAGVERESFYRLMRRFGVVADGRTSEPPGATS